MIFWFYFRFALDLSWSLQDIAVPGLKQNIIISDFLLLRKCIFRTSLHICIQKIIWENSGNKLLISSIPGLDVYFSSSFLVSLGNNLIETLDYVKESTSVKMISVLECRYFFQM